jgi:sugar phosphate isomerase/epimerase
VIAVQLYTVRSLLQDPATIGGVLARLREMGYETVEVAGLGPKTVDRFGEEMRRAGLSACAAHVSLERLTEDFDGAVAECKAWECQYVVVPALPEGYRSAEGFRRFGQEAAGIAERLGEHGLRFAYHNHAYELERSGGRTWLEGLLDTAPKDALEAELDTYWLQYGGVNPAAWIRRLGGRVPLVHLKDLAIVDGDPVDAEVGEGNLDWRDILEACREAETKWLIVEQDAPRGDPLESVALSCANLEKLLSAVGGEG